MALALAYWFLRKRRLRRSQEKHPLHQSTTDETSFFSGKAELSGDARQAQHFGPVELRADAQTPQEMGSDKDKNAAAQKTPKSTMEMEAECRAQQGGKRGVRLPA